MLPVESESANFRLADNHAGFAVRELRRNSSLFMRVERAIYFHSIRDHLRQKRRFLIQVAPDYLKAHPTY